MGALTHMHLRVKAPVGKRWYAGDGWDCPFCNPDNESRAYEVAVLLESYIREHAGQVIGEYEMRRQVREDGITDAEISHALRYLAVTVCHSCRAVITHRNAHREPCVHSPTGWPK